jgi:glyoxylate carboligase
LDLSSRGYRLDTASGLNGRSNAPTAAERVLAAELQVRSDDNDALSMMVSSMARMVQAGKTRDSRWKAT